DQLIFWVHQEHQCCNRCAHPDHLIKNCTIIQSRARNENRINRLATIIEKKRLEELETTRILTKARLIANRKKPSKNQNILNKNQPMHRKLYTDDQKPIASSSNPKE